MGYGGEGCVPAKRVLLGNLSSPSICCGESHIILPTSVYVYSAVLGLDYSRAMLLMCFALRISHVLGSPLDTWD